jgi:hypothetical protein
MAAPDELLVIDEALAKLAAEDPRAAQLVQLRYFAGLSVEEAAELSGLSRSSAYEHWSIKEWVAKERVQGESLEILPCSPPSRPV